MIASILSYLTVVINSLIRGRQMRIDREVQRYINETRKQYK